MPEEIFTMSGKLNDRPIYKSENGEIGLWFDGQSGKNADWIFGNFTNIAKNQTTEGFLTSDEDTPCPNYVAKWEEYNGQKWSQNINANVYCYGAPSSANQNRGNFFELFLTTIFVIWTQLIN